MSTTTKNEKRTLTFVKIEKESQNCYRYQEQLEAGKPSVIGGLYVKKNAFKKMPLELKVTVEVVKSRDV